MLGIEASFLSEKQRAEVAQRLYRQYPWLKDQDDALQSMEKAVQELMKNPNMSEEVRTHIMTVLTSVRTFVIHDIE